MSEQQVQGFYDALAGDYDAQRFARPYYRHIDRLERAFVLEQVAPGASVLEVGPGTGRFTVHLLAVASSVTAVDISAAMLEHLEQRVTSTRLATVRLSVSDLSFLPGYGGFDTAIAMRLLPHLEDPVAALTTMTGAIKPGGNVVFDLWNPYSFVGLVCWLANRPSHVLTKRYSYRHILRMVEAAGLTVEDTFAWGYPRIGRFSADRLGNHLLKPLGYSILFNTVRG